MDSLKGHEMEIAFLQQGMQVAIRESKRETKIVLRSSDEIFKWPFGLVKIVPNKKAIEDNEKVYFFANDGTSEVLNMTQIMHDKITAEIKKRSKRNE